MKEKITTTSTDEILERIATEVRESIKSFIGLPYNKETGCKIEQIANNLLDQLGITNLRFKYTSPNTLLLIEAISIK